MNRRELLKTTAVAMGIGSASSLLMGALAGFDDSKQPPDIEQASSTKPLIAALAELIIPETDTPGAIAAGVPEFIEQIVSQWYTPTERKIFLAGLVAIDTYCQDRYGQGFTGCNLKQQTEALAYFEQQASQYKPPPRDMFDRTDPEDTPFFNKIRELTVFGYYTSEVGATQELRWLPMPGRYLVDYPLDEVGRAWAN